MLTKVLPAAAVLLALASAAGAADLPVAAAPVPVALPAPSWNGWYFGMNAGAVTGNGNMSTNGSVLSSSYDTSPAGTSDTAAIVASSVTGAIKTNSTGFLGGGQVGRNWVVNSGLLLGVEADLQASSLNGCGTFSRIVDSQFYAGSYYASSSVSTCRNLDWLGTVRGRIGGLLTPTFLVYATGGLAYGGVSGGTTTNSGLFEASNCVYCYGAPPASVVSTTFGNVRTGWTAGAGGEWMFAPHWTARVEYLYYDLGSVSYGAGTIVNNENYNSGGYGPGFGTSSAVIGSSAKFNGNIVRFGLNYLLN